MSRTELVVFSVKISGKHPDHLTKLYYGVGYLIEDVMLMVNNAAKSEGWTEIEYDDISKLGKLSFAPWTNEKESEDEQCQS
ncbi:MAG: hypothetical protein ACYS3S_16605 [Planctomycetota bacterium]|jgi:hypothetical protein